MGRALEGRCFASLALLRIVLHMRVSFHALRSCEQRPPTVCCPKTQHATQQPGAAPQRRGTSASPVSRSDVQDASPPQQRDEEPRGDRHRQCGHNVDGVEILQDARGAGRGGAGARNASAQGLRHRHAGACGAQASSGGGGARAPHASAARRCPRHLESSPLRAHTHPRAVNAAQQRISAHPSHITHRRARFAWCSTARRA
jgi:hypothetical protein